MEQRVIISTQLESELVSALSECVIRPQNPIKVGRTGSDTKKLEELYEEGYECGRQITQL